MTLATTLIPCRQNGFAFVGGWSRRILYDNLHQVVVGPERVNARFLDFYPLPLLRGEALPAVLAPHEG